LEELYGKPLPPGVPIGESWEISDRPGDQSVIANGALAGRDLHWLVTNHSAELFGPNAKRFERFPLLVKILDATETLSVQVHPPAMEAKKLGGEPKTELWYIAAAEPGAELFAGLKRGTTRNDFEKRIRDGTVAECIHRVKAYAGDAMFLPSGRVHALGAGLVIFEVQQNSDTTYRVFDWNRAGLDGKPRALHVAQSLASIDFEDFEPGLAPAEPSEVEPGKPRILVRDPLFTVEVYEVDAGKTLPIESGKMHILAMLEGGGQMSDGNNNTVSLGKGQFCLLPAGLRQPSFQAEQSGRVMRIEAGLT
jgi:mannose-6-phosphate isomerase